MVIKTAMIGISMILVLLGLRRLCCFCCGYFNCIIIIYIVKH